MGSGQATLHNTIRTAVASALGSVPVVYDNGPAATADIWARCSIRPAETSQADISSSRTTTRYRTRGVLLLSLFCKPEIGDKPLLDLADTVVPSFRSITISGVVFRTPSVSIVGRSGSSWQINVSCPFYADNIGA